MHAPESTRHMHWLKKIESSSCFCFYYRSRLVVHRNMDQAMNTRSRTAIQYSLGSRIVVTNRSPSVITYTRCWSAKRYIENTRALLLRAARLAAWSCWSISAQSPDWCRLNRSLVSTLIDASTSRARGVMTHSPNEKSPEATVISLFAATTIGSRDKNITGHLHRIFSRYHHNNACFIGACIDLSLRITTAPIPLRLSHWMADEMTVLQSVF